MQLTNLDRKTIQKIYYIRALMSFCNNPDVLKMSIVLAIYNSLMNKFKDLKNESNLIFKTRKK